MANFDDKDPDDIDFFSWDFTDELASGETISSKAFPDFPAGLTLNTSIIDGSKVTATIQGGTAGESYSVTCRITTSTGRQLDFTNTIPVSAQ